MDTDCIKTWLKENLSEERYLHSLGCADAAIVLAEKYGLDSEKAYLAGLLHDCAKCMKNEELLEIIKEKIKDVDVCELKNYKTLHAPVSAYFAKKKFGVEDSEILSAIRWHTLGRIDMTLFESAIFLADKIETNTRDKKFNQEIREILSTNDGQKGIDLALLKCFETTIISLARRKLEICSPTVDVYNDLLNKTR
jgi:predicted HD superfamily hydrolase involved in NAD metabolism